MKVLELRIPPPLLLLAAGLLMWLLARWSPYFQVAVPFPISAQAAILFAGGTVSALGVVEFRRRRTTLNPSKPDDTSCLVTSGIFGWTRNPMYLGLVVILSGWAIHLSNLAALACLPCFVYYLRRFQIGPEERVLLGKYDEDFRSYCRQVRRWI